MRYIRLALYLFTTLLCACKSLPGATAQTLATGNEWNATTLKEKAQQQLDRQNWDIPLFQQDVATYTQYAGQFAQYPLNNYAFPVAQYDYAVYSNPFTIPRASHTFQGVQLGEYANPESEEIITRLTLWVYSSDDATAPDTFVSSRNYPYLTAQGYFPVNGQNYNWVFHSTPDGYASLLFSMKLFDLRFGPTILLFPQPDYSFVYLQLEESPDTFSDFEAYVNSVLANPMVTEQITRKP